MGGPGLVAPRWSTRPVLVVTALVWLPAILLLTAIGASAVTGCRVDEAGAYPCPVLGIDIGGLLNAFAVSGWLMLVTLPFMAITAALWLGRGLYVLGRRMLADRGTSG